MRVQNINNKPMRMIDYEYIIEKIINALTHPGELMTDGECMDEVWGFLESKGYDLDFSKKEREDYYNSHGEKAYKIIYNYKEYS